MGLLANQFISAAGDAALRVLVELPGLKPLFQLAPADVADPIQFRIIHDF
jgi:hypothetical protein